MKNISSYRLRSGFKRRVALAILVFIAICLSVSSHAQTDRGDVDNGVEVRIKDIARFRGVRSNQISNIGIVVGLSGTGDTRNSPWAQQAISNLVRDYGITIDPQQVRLKNVAIVMVTAELPPFARPGNRIDVTVSSIGDATSLQGGYLLQTPLMAPSNREVAYAVAMGSVSIGGFNVSAGGSSRQKNHTTVGMVTSGAVVERSVETSFRFDGRMYLELDEADFTTAERIASAINQSIDEVIATAKDGGTVEINSGSTGLDPVALMSRIEMISVVPDIPATIVVNERTGTIVVGGNVKIGPAMIAHGGLTVKINQYNEVIQPPPLSGGTTETQTNTEVEAKENKVHIGVIQPNATIADLAKVFRALRVTPRDMIAIIQALKAQGAIKATVKTQ